MGHQFFINFERYKFWEVLLYKSNAPKCFPLSLPFALFYFTLSCFAPITYHVMRAKGHITCQVGYAQGLVACYIPPSILNMPKTCKTLTQNMSRNAEVKKMGQTADYGKHNCSRTHVLTALPSRVNIGISLASL